MQQAQTAREASGRDQVFWNKRGRKVPTLALGSSSWEKGMTGVGSDETVVEIGPRDPLAPFSPNPPLGGSPKHDGIRLQNRRVKPVLLLPLGSLCSDARVTRPLIFVVKQTLPPWPNCGHLCEYFLVPDAVQHAVQQ